MNETEIRDTLEELEREFDFQPIGEQNPKIKQIRAILSNSKPNPEKLFVAEGFWITNKLVKYDVEIKSFIMSKELIKTNEGLFIAKEMTKRAEELYVVSSRVFEKISERDKSDGLLAIAKLPARDLNDFKIKDKSVILVLDGVEIPGNIGTMVRVADGAGISAVFI